MPAAENRASAALMENTASTKIRQRKWFIFNTDRANIDRTNTGRATARGAAAAFVSARAVARQGRWSYILCLEAMALT